MDLNLAPQTLPEVKGNFDQYKGKDFDTCRLTNPCITKRQVIHLANAIAKIVKPGGQS